MSHPVVTYGGVELPKVTPLWAQWVAQNVDPQSLFAAHGHSDVPRKPCRLGTLHWPRGASRFAVAHFLVADDDLKLIRPLAYAGSGRYRALEFTLDDGDGGGITTELFMLPPRPLAQCLPHLKADRELYLLSLVDERFFWAERDTEVAITGGTTTWAELLDLIASALGVGLVADDVPAAYLQPPGDFPKGYGSLPSLLDAACDSVGLRVVRLLDGTLYAQAPAASKARQDAQLKSWARQAGGTLALDAKYPPHDLQAQVPSGVTVIFPRSDNGVAANDSYAASVALPSLLLPHYGGVIGHGGTKFIRSSCAANFTGGGTPVNAAELTALARQIARDWYRWQLARQESVFAGVADYVPEALSDAAEWRLRDGDVSTRILRGPETERGEPLGHHGTYGSLTTCCGFAFSGTPGVNYTITPTGTITFPISTSASVPPIPGGGGFAPPYISVTGAPTFTPTVGIFPWIMTNTGLYWWNGSAWTLIAPTAPATAQRNYWEYYRQISDKWYFAGSHTAPDDTDISLALTNDILYAVPFISPRGGTLDRLAVEIIGATPTTDGQLVIYEATSATDLYPSARVLTATFDAGITGRSEVTVNQALDPTKLYWLALVVEDSAISIRGLNSTNCFAVLGTEGAAPASFRDQGVALSVAEVYSANPSDPFPAGASIITSNDVGAVPLIAARYSA